MERAQRTYVFCNGCERRIDEELMKANRCRGCHADAKRKLLAKEKNFFEEDDYDSDVEYV